VVDYATVFNGFIHISCMLRSFRVDQAVERKASCLFCSACCTPGRTGAACKEGDNFSLTVTGVLCGKAASDCEVG